MRFIMPYISSDKRINNFCNQLIKSKKWIYDRGTKHSLLKHATKGGFKTLVVSSTPSDARAFANFRRDYNRYIRAFLIQSGVIRPKLPAAA